MKSKEILRFFGKKPKKFPKSLRCKAFPVSFPAEIPSLRFWLPFSFPIALARLECYNGKGRTPPKTPRPAGKEPFL